MTDYESHMMPVLSHLAWLAERIGDEANAGRAYDAALLTYNGAAMLQWRFVAPMGNADVISTKWLRAEAAEAIDGLVTSSEKTVAKAANADGNQDKRLRARLVTEINRVVEVVARSLQIALPTPTRMPELESSPNVRELVDEFLAAHVEQYAAAIEEGRIRAAKMEVGPDAALKEAIAGLIYIHDDARAADMSPGLSRPLAQMAAGFFKTAVEQQTEASLPPAQKRQLLGLADGLVESAASAHP
jgi:hypothetical protein